MIAQIVDGFFVCRVAVLIVTGGIQTCRGLFNINCSGDGPNIPAAFRGLNDSDAVAARISD